MLELLKVGFGKLQTEVIDWTPTSDNVLSLAIGALAMDPSNPEVLYAGTGEGNFGGDSQYGLGIIKNNEMENRQSNDGNQKKMEYIYFDSRFCRIAVNPKNSNHILLLRQLYNCLWYI